MTDIKASMELDRRKGWFLGFDHGTIATDSGTITVPFTTTTTTTGVDYGPYIEGITTSAGSWFSSWMVVRSKLVKLTERQHGMVQEVILDQIIEHRHLL